MKDNALYLEADEDITSAIDKLTKSAGDSVQIVVPKRSTMLQSIINLKLLKKAAETAGKELVLVTNDRIAGDLASRVGLAVAPSIGAKPVITEAEIPEQLKNNEEIIEADDPEPPQPAPEPEPPKPARGPMLKRRPVSDDAAPAAAVAAGLSGAPDAAASADKSAGKPSGPKVPNFHKLQRRVLWLVLAVVLVVGYMVTMFFISSAKVTLYANGSKFSIDTTFSADPQLKTTDAAKGVLAGQTVTISKDLSGSFTPTGKKDAGTKASGKMTASNATGVDQVLVAGTRFAAPDGKLFRSSAEVTVPKAYLNNNGDKVNGTVTVDVTADQNGDSYNEGPAGYTIPALANPKITAQGAQMAGGTTKTVTVVTQSDVDTAKAAIIDKDKDNTARDLQGKLPTGYVPLTASQTSTTTSSTPSPAVDAEGSTGTLIIKQTYSVMAVKQSEYQDLVRAQELKQIGDKNQVYDDGLSAAQVTTSDKDPTTRETFHLTTDAYGGSKIDLKALAEQLKGKRYSDAVDTATHQVGVTRAEVSLWPAWSTNVPSRTGKINIVIQPALNK